MVPLLLSLVALAALTPLAQSHFTFVRIKTDGKWHEPLQYIRNKTDMYNEWKYYNSNFLYRGWNWPTYVIDRPESVRCGRDNMRHAPNTDVLTVKAGQELEIVHIRASPEEWVEDYFQCEDMEDRGVCFRKPGWYNDFNHPGPLVVHLSKAPEGQDIRSYDGTGEWIKIHRIGLDDPEERPLNWTLYRKVPQKIIFKIPAQTPAGQYLMRMDVIWSGWQSEYIKPPAAGLAEMYPSCAQLNIVSDSTKELPQGVKIPEIFDIWEPGMTTSGDMLDFKSLDANYTYPGGLLWDGEKMNIDSPYFEWYK
ncbi:lytic polysaccharide monooxygenase [Sporormia fimetaria CBS 119925]|uniref:lytic cellulose monooxygenase (C4-dehydrogenating) n=1 Tax=Sporormia fimetaria CBS 119925 TaxID=1340428 RepID=A0A6A6UVH0_9PLEO|nr:lytic polysaccharide monooxygenase [Sporormia fimetaria CBS 119925]